MGPEGWEAQHFALFSLSRHYFHSFFLSWGWFRGILAVLLKAGTLKMCTFGLSGCRVKLEHNNTTTQQHNNTTTQQHNNNNTTTTQQQHNNTTTQQHNNNNNNTTTTTKQHKQLAKIGFAEVGLNRQTWPLPKYPPTFGPSTRQQIAPWRSPVLLLHNLREGKFRQVLREVGLNCHKIPLISPKST